MNLRICKRAKTAPLGKRIYFFRKRITDSSKPVLGQRPADAPDKSPNPREDPISRKEALEVILWYQVFLPPKLHRALLSKTEEMETEEDDLPKDSEGSAKIALIGIDRSLSAWGELAAQWEGKGAAIGKIVNHLTCLREMVEKEFPQARAFLRPGFDTPDGELHS